MESKKIIFFGQVKDNIDPQGIGRIRVEPKTEVMTYIYPEGFTDSDKWTSKDPLIFLPLLPYYITQVPKIDEYVQIIYSNSKERYDSNKFYIQGPISRPWNNKFESYNNSQSVLASGENLKQSDSIIDPNSGKVKITLDGVYVKPGDVGLVGRGSSDVVLVEDEKNGSSNVLLRSGKFLSSGNDNIPVIKNDKRSFLQISSFELENIDAGNSVITTEIYDDINTNTYVEWSIDNLNDVSDFYDCTINFYSLPKNLTNTKVSKINVNSDKFGGMTLTPLYSLSFTGKTIDESSTIINNFIRGVNESKIQIDGYMDYPSSNGVNIENQFPFFYGPSKNTYDNIISNLIDLTNSVVSTNKSLELFDKITLSLGYEERGYGLVWSYTPPKLGILTNTKIEQINKRDYLVNPITYSVMGADKLYLLSHKSDNKFSINLKDTLYGIPQDKLVNDIHGKTNSMVRGEELINFMKDIVSFMLSHVHPFPGKEPIQEYPNVPNGPSASKIQQTLNNADNLILNQNIRIN
jgi:hypothetical protein